MADDFLLNRCRSSLHSRRTKYNRNFRRYTASPNVDLDSLASGSVAGMGVFGSLDEDLAPAPVTNVVKSVIDTLASKIATTKVRPYFTGLNGSWETVKVLRDSQQFFDDYFDKQDVNKKIVSAFVKACVFDTGVLFLNTFTNEVEALNPHCVGVLETEVNVGKLTRLLVQYKCFPTTLLRVVYGVDVTNAEWATLELFYDVEAHSVSLIVNNSVIEERPYVAEVIPAVFLYYNSPIFGRKNTSLVDDLYWIQVQIDDLNEKVSAATQLTPSNLILAPEGTSNTIENLDNRSGQILRYKPMQGVTNPIEIVTPAPINGGYVELLNFYITKAYEFAGISELSAQSRKPQGLDSGVALQSMENIESDRFAVQLNSVIRAYVDLAKLMILVLPDDLEVLPHQYSRPSITWAELKQQVKQVNIQFSAQNQLSKDPETKLRQLSTLMNAGLIKPYKVAQLLDMPDLNKAYSEASAVSDAIGQVIERALNGVITLTDFIDYTALTDEILSLQNQLFATGDEEGVKRLQALSEAALEFQVDNGLLPPPRVEPPQAVNPTQPPELAEGEQAIEQTQDALLAAQERRLT